MRKLITTFIVAALVSGCATVTPQQLTSMTPVEVCTLWGNSANQYDAAAADQEITKRRLSGDKLNCTVALSDFGVCVVAVGGPTQAGYAMGREEAQARGINCETPEVYNYINERQRLALQRQQLGLNQMAFGAYMLNQSQQYKNPPRQTIRCTSSTMGSFTDTTCR